MSDVVEYILKLKDDLSAGIKSASAATTALNSKLEHTNEISGRLKETLGALGISFGLFKGVEFIQESVEAMHNLHEAEGQVRAGLESTRYAAGLTFDELEESAGNFSKKIKYSRGEIMQMQSILITFPSITKNVFDTASQAIFDMSSRLHQDLQSSAIQLGKALQDPERGITALRRVGVNFNEAQTEMVKHMVATGHQAQAQAFILKELQTEFAGSAAAAFNSDPLAKFNKTMAQIKMQMGDLAITVLKELQPSLESLANKMVSAFKYVKENVLPVIKSIGNFIIEYKEPIKIIGAMIAAYYSLTTAVSLAKTAVAAFSLVLSPTPLGLFAIGLGAVAYAIMKVRGQWQELQDQMNSAAQKAAIEAQEDESNYINQQLDLLKKKKGINEEIAKQQFLAAESRKLEMEYETKVGKFSSNNVSQTVKDAWKLQIEARKKALKEFSNPKGANGQGTNPFDVNAPTENNNVTERKNTIINITMGSLVNTFTVGVTNLQEGSAKVREEILKAMISAVNDSQVHAIGNT